MTPPKDPQFRGTTYDAIRRRNGKVWVQKKPYTARACVGHVQIYIGRFATREEAAEAVRTYEGKHR